MTINEVAERAGVSMATVSRALNNRRGPSSATVSRVIEAAKALGYEVSPPSSRAGRRVAAPKVARHGQIALLMLDNGFHLHGETFAKLLEGVVGGAEAQGVGVIVGMPGTSGNLPPQVVQNRWTAFCWPGRIPMMSSWRTCQTFPASG